MLTTQEKELLASLTAPGDSEAAMRSPHLLEIGQDLWVTVSNRIAFAAALVTREQTVMLRRFTADNPPPILFRSAIEGRTRPANAIAYEFFSFVLQQTLKHGRKIGYIGGKPFDYTLIAPAFDLFRGAQGVTVEVLTSSDMHVLRLNTINRVFVVAGLDEPISLADEPFPNWDAPVGELRLLFAA